MNKEKWFSLALINGYRYVARLMEKKGYVSRYINTNSYTDELESILIEFEPNHIVFPILEMEGSIPVELLGRRTKLYTGVVSEEWKKPYKEAHLFD